MGEMQRADGWQDDGAGFERTKDPARALFELPLPWSGVGAPGEGPEKILEKVVTVTHDVPIGDGRTLRLNEHFSLGTWLRQPRRAILFLGSAFARGDFWSIPVAGYNGTVMAVAKGAFAFTVDYIGIGDSYRPVDGHDSTFAANQAALQVVLRFIRSQRAVAKIDLVGESWGGIHALYLAADADRVGRCVMSTMTYEIPAIPQFATPEYVAFLEGLPDHYLPMGPDFYAQITQGSPPEVTAWAQETQPGLYLTTHFRDAGKGLPHFDPGIARTPGLVISGSNDRPEDGERLARLYGTEGARFVVVQGGHGVRLETPTSAAHYWKEVFSFLEI